MPHTPPPPHLTEDRFIAKTTPTIEPLNIQSEQFIYLNYFMILILMLFGINFCICLLLCSAATWRVARGVGGSVFHYNNKITEAFNTPPTLHTRFLSLHQKLPFRVFAASARNFPRYFIST